MKMSGVAAFLVSTLLIAPVSSGLSPDDLASKVTIRRDTWGVPHIKAETEPALAFGFGYASAEDHVLTMARLYLTARGEQSRYFGAAFAASDLRVKQMQVYEGARKGFAKTPPAFQEYLSGFALGYNRYLEGHRADLPDWVMPIDGVDLLAHARNAIVFGFTVDLAQVARIGRTETAASEEFTNEESRPGSNMFAIGKPRSESGNTLLLGNPHLAWAGSQLFYEAQLTVPGKVNFMGASLVGFPVLALGFNEHLGWSHTVNPNDSTDIYELQIDPADSDRYLYNGKSIAFEKQILSIEVKTDDGMESRTQEARWSVDGPIVKALGDKVYALKSASYHEYRLLEQWYKMTKASSYEEFREALAMQALPMFNIGYADRKGNFFYLYNGRMPDRPDGPYDWAGVVPGGIPETQWKGILPLDRLPQLLNPASGYIQNCNSAPWYTNKHTPIDKTLFHPALLPDENSLRTQMGLRILESDDSITFEELQAYKFTNTMLMALRIKRDLLQAARGKTVDGVDLSDAVRVLQSWDNTVSRESVGSVLFERFLRRYVRRNDRIFENAWDADSPFDTPSGLGNPEKALKDLAEAAKEVEREYGKIDVVRCDVYRLRRGDLDVPLGGASGNYGVIRVINFARQPDGVYTPHGGDSYVFVVEFGPRIRARSILAYSESENPDSPHYNDQSRLFADERFKDTWFYEDDLAANIERSYRP